MLEGRFTDNTGYRLLEVVNDSGEAVPPFAAMRLTGLDPDNVPKVDKPSADGQTDKIVFNGPVAIPATVDQGRGGQSLSEEVVQGKGVAYISYPALAYCYKSDGTPANDETWGTVAGQWYLRKGKAGFKVVGNAQATSDANYAQVMPDGSATAGFWARIVEKNYPADPATGGYVEYVIIPVTDSADPVALVWTEASGGVADVSGSGALVAYEVNNIDLPVSDVPYGTGSGMDDDHPTIVWVVKGSGDYYLFNMVPRWEFVERIGDATVDNGIAYYPGSLLRYNQETGLLEGVEDVDLIDANTELA